MQRFETKYFGSIAYASESVIDFPLGLPGFEQERRFVVIEQAINKPIVFLQSLSRPELCFITLPVGRILPDYQGYLSAEELRSLGLQDDVQPAPNGKTLWLGIVALSEEGPATINLLSPIVIHWTARLAVQAIQADLDYSHRHPLFAASPEAPCS
jgi:flagellar assembly factor FliW